MNCSIVMLNMVYYVCTDGIKRKVASAKDHIIGQLNGINAVN